MAADHLLSVSDGALPLLLESFARAQRYVPATAVSLLLEEDLPMCLRSPAREAGPCAAWRAWVENERVWFLIGRVPQRAGKQGNFGELELLFFSCGGEAVAAGAWALTADGAWALRCVLEPEDFMRKRDGRQPGSRFRQRRDGPADMAHGGVHRGLIGHS